MPGDFRSRQRRWSRRRGRPAWPSRCCPGPSAAFGVAVLSGFPLAPFHVRGIPAARARARGERPLRDALREDVTTVWYESPRRIRATPRRPGSRGARRAGFSRARVHEAARAASARESGRASPRASPNRFAARSPSRSPRTARPNGPPSRPPATSTRPSTRCSRKTAASARSRNGSPQRGFGEPGRPLRPRQRAQGRRKGPRRTPPKARRP